MNIPYERPTETTTGGVERPLLQDDAAPRVVRYCFCDVINMSLLSLYAYFI